MPIEHSNISDPYLHEPKDISTAVNGQVYTADGLGVGSWEHSNPHGGMYFVDIASPYTITYPSVYTKIDPTTLDTGHQLEFTNSGSGRLTYTGTIERHFLITINLSVDQSVGSSRDIQCAVYKNGILLPQSENIRSTTSAEKASMSVHADTLMTTNDYIEVFIKNNGASGDVNIYNIYVFVQGMAKD